MLKGYVFLVIIVSASVTWLTVYLSEKSSCLTADTDTEKGTEKEADNSEREESEDYGSLEESENYEDQSQTRDTSSVLRSFFCSLAMCFLVPFTYLCCRYCVSMHCNVSCLMFHCYRFVKGEDPYTFTLFLSKGLLVVLERIPGSVLESLR